MSTIEELEKRISILEQELYEAKMLAAGAFESQKASATRLGYKFHLVNPQMFNSKLQWLGYNFWDYHPARYYINDKYFFKYYLATMIGNEYNVPLLGVYDELEAFDYDALPERFVIKRTLGGGSYEVQLVDKSKDEKESVIQTVKKWLNNHENGVGRVIAEQMLEFDSEDIVDYKFFVFNGKVEFCLACVAVKETDKRELIFYHMDWSRYNIRINNSKWDVPKPEKLDEMVRLSEEIGTHFPFIRVDMFVDKYGKVYIGELTGLPANGYHPYGPAVDKMFGDLLQLPTQEEIHAYFEEAYRTFPELRENPIFLKGKNPSYRIIQPNNPSGKLPLPPKCFMQPAKKK